METALKTKRFYTKRTRDERQHLLARRLFSLKRAHAKRAGLIRKLEKKLTLNRIGE